MLSRMLRVQSGRDMRNSLLAVIVLLALCFGCADEEKDKGQGADAVTPPSGVDGGDETENGSAFPVDPEIGTGFGLSREHFDLLVDGGVDDRIQSYPWAMELFDGDGDGEPEIYVGTIANALCLQLPMVPLLFELIPGLRPAECWECNIDHWDPYNWLPFYLDNLDYALVFRGTRQKNGAGWQWERVFEPTLNEAGGFRGGIVYKGALYMLGASRLGAMVWKTTDGQVWERASENGVVADHAGYTKFLRAATIYQGKLYVASSSPASTYIYASDDPAPGNWEVVNDNGFIASGGISREVIYEQGKSTGGNTVLTLRDTKAALIPFYYGGGIFQVRITDGVGAGQSRLIYENTSNTLILRQSWETAPDESSRYEIYRPDAGDNGPIYQMAVFNDRLYAAPFNATTGAELWYADDPAPGQWRRVIAEGYGQSQTEGFMTLAPFGDFLYLGTSVYPGHFVDVGNFTGTEVLRINAEHEVDLLVGEPRVVDGTTQVQPLSGMRSGFDYRANLYSWNSIVYNGWLYVGTFDVAGLGNDFVHDWFPDDVPDMFGQMGETILGPDHDRWGGFDLWRTQDGIVWHPVSLDGFEQVRNYGVRSFADSPWGLLTGVANPYDGFEIWLGAR